MIFGNTAVVYREKVLALLVYLLFMVPLVVGAPTVYSPEVWAEMPNISSVLLSPDGKHLALLRTPPQGGPSVIEVFDASDLSKLVHRQRSDPMEIQGFRWVNNETIVFELRQQIKKSIKGFNQGVWAFRVASVDITKRTMNMFGAPGWNLEHPLHGKPNEIVVSFVEGGSGKAYRPRSYYRYNLKTGRQRLLVREKIGVGMILLDREGNPRTARGFDKASDEYIFYYRPPGTKKWVDIYRQSEDGFEVFSVVGEDYAKPEHLLVIAHNGNDKAGLWSFDTKTKKFVELIYHRSDVDVAGVIRHGNAYKNRGQVVGVVAFKDKMYREYFDEMQGAIHAQLMDLIPNAEVISFNTSQDGTSYVIFNYGSRDPGTYYLLRDGKLNAIGSLAPRINSQDLADVRYVEYQSRDGIQISGYITVPQGAPPFPLIVLPHGGPFVSEYVSYDPWAQMLANHGYMVLQPQYRGSRNYGIKFYTSAFMKGGEGGGAMQDDKDYGALYLVEQGLADRERLAMLGWSYGGYAALVASARTPQIYQCVIAAAAVSDPLTQVNWYRYHLRGARRVEQLRMWDDSVSPIKEVANVNVPILLVHGSIDQRVPPLHAAKYRNLLNKHKKNYKYVELVGADHFLNTLTYDHKRLAYSEMLSFLKEDCGPGGL